MKRREGYHLPESCLYSKNKREKIEFREKLLFLDFLAKNRANVQTIAIASLLDL